MTLMGFSYKAREARGHLPGSPLPAGPRIPDLPGEPAPSHSHGSGHAVTPSAVTDTGLRKGRGSLSTQSADRGNSKENPEPGKMHLGV